MMLCPRSSRPWKFGMSLSPTAKGDVVPLVRAPRAVIVICVRLSLAEGGAPGSKSTDVSPAVTEPVGHCRWTGTGASTGGGATVSAGDIDGVSIFGGESAGAGARLAMRVGFGVAVGLAAESLVVCEDGDCLEAGVEVTFTGFFLPDSITPAATAPPATARAMALRTAASQSGNFLVPEGVIYGV